MTSISTPSTPASPDAAASAPRQTKLAAIEALLARAEGASLAELVTATGWQPHSVRGVLAGTLRKKGHVITSAKDDGVRRYQIAVPQ